MKKSILITLLLLGGCASTPETSLLDKKITDGSAERLSLQQYTDLVAGNTLKSNNGSYTYYRSDGVKLVYNEGGITQRKWYKDDSGVLCQTLFKSNKLSCLNGTNFQAARSESTLFTIPPDSTNISAWEIIQGTPLSE